MKNKLITETIYLLSLLLTVGTHITLLCLTPIPLYMAFAFSELLSFLLGLSYSLAEGCDCKWVSVNHQLWFRLLTTTSDLTSRWYSMLTTDDVDIELRSFIRKQLGQKGSIDFTLFKNRYSYKKHKHIDNLIAKYVVSYGLCVDYVNGRPVHTEKIL